MKVVVFELSERRFALKLAAVERILAPGEATPSGCRLLDLGARFGLGGSEDPGGDFRVLLAGKPLALLLGRPLGTAWVDPAWILPLPGYMFRTPGGAPFGGLIDVTDTGETASGIAHQSLLLDEERIEATR